MIYKIIKKHEDSKSEELKIIENYKRGLYRSALNKELKRLGSDGLDEIEIGKYKICLEKVGDVVREGRLIFTKKGFIHCYNSKGGLELFNFLG